MADTYALGQFLTLVEADASVYHRFQNFYLNQTVEWENGPHVFMPFGFSGIAVDLEGANVDSSLVFPNKSIARDWATKAVENAWFARVSVVRCNIDNPGALTQDDRLYHYNAQVDGATWDDERIVLSLSSVLDSVRPNVPNRRLSRVLCGHLPVTSNVRF
jgi:hypothetical protein